MANFELNKKLEEKTNVIKDLSNQLSVHESNFKEVKNELKQVIFHLWTNLKINNNFLYLLKTKLKQAELDKTFNLTMEDIKKIQDLCTFSINDPECIKILKHQIF